MLNDGGYLAKALELTDGEEYLVVRAKDPKRAKGSNLLDDPNTRPSSSLPTLKELERFPPEHSRGHNYLVVGWALDPTHLGYIPDAIKTPTHCSADLDNKAETYNNMSRAFRLVVRLESTERFSFYTLPNPEQYGVCEAVTIPKNTARARGDIFFWHPFRVSADQKEANVRFTAWKKEIKKVRDLICGTKQNRTTDIRTADFISAIENWRETGDDQDLMPFVTEMALKSRSHKSSADGNVFGKLSGGVMLSQRDAISEGFIDRVFVSEGRQSSTTIWHAF